MKENDPISHNDELYDMLVETRQALTYRQRDKEIGQPDIEEEWQRLIDCRQRRRLVRSRQRIAAVIAALVLMTGLTFAAIRLVSTYRHRTPESTESVQQTARRQRSVKADSPSVKPVRPTKKAPVVFENVTLELILTHVSAAYGCRVNYANEASRQVRLYLQWDKQDDLPALVDKINHFEKIHLTYHPDQNLLTVE